MKICVSVFARFHAFYLARQLEERGHLQRLITSYPKFEVAKYGVPRNKVISLLAQELASRAWNKIPASLKGERDPQFWLHERFDRAAVRHLPDDLDLFVGWSSFCERGLKRAKERGAVALVERGSAHIEYQRDILREEYEQFGFKSQLPHPEIVLKELREYELADYISVPSEFVRRSFIEKGFNPNKIIKVPYGVDIKQFAPVDKQDDVFRVVFAGNMSLQKGVHYLLQAFAELNLPRAELWLVGAKQAEIEPFFQKYEGNFRYLGFIPQGKLFEYYSQCSVFALCSIQDGYGMVLPQAMACGLPIICTTNTGAEDLITEGVEGFVVPIRDVEALKAKISWLYHHPDACAVMGRSAILKVQQGFTWGDYGETICHEYQRVLEAKSR